ncbi:hypothetical protein LshimejAT787_0101570 [Lyophyllum shimeji]|uniref:Uncharacterized protein n=1 Tax=Lyophyllum shimeji TaxID=47721 RepID=A0A9P3PD62_LYOSH|nr:hypothetical protein LshimejAT787_0101570 [Lyophyllum shimeji]
MSVFRSPGWHFKLSVHVQGDPRFIVSSELTVANAFPVQPTNKQTMAMLTYERDEAVLRELTYLSGLLRASATELNRNPVSTGEDGNGWVSIEEVLVRLNTTYTPKGKFPRKSDVSVPDKNGGPTWIEYDAAVCVQLFEPWVLEVFNSTTGLPSSMKIVEKGNEIRSMDTAQTQEKLAGWPVTDPDVNRQLNSSRLADVYACGHTNSVNQMLKDDGRDAFYVPSPTVVSFTDGKGSLGYTELSEKFFAQARGLADASNILPYFAGSGKTLARRYNDRVLSSASVNPVYMGTYVAFILVVGLVAGFFVPKLPLDVPHRGFEVYSWIAAFHAGSSSELGGSYECLVWLAAFMGSGNVSWDFTPFAGALRLSPVVVNINAVVIHQREYYDEVAILGDNSDADIARATELKPRFDDFALTWTLAPFSTHGGLPPVVSFDWNGDTVYFSETILSQLLSNGSGFGTFATETADPSLKLHSTTQPTGDAIEPGAVLRFPRWGTRIHCAKIPDPEINIITRSLNTFTYVFTPRAVLESLFTSFGMGYPTTLMPFNASKVLQLNDTLPVGLDPAQTALGAAFYDNGVGHSFFSSPVSTGEDGNGWVSIEEVLVRLNTTYTPKGKFPRKSDVSVPDKNGGPTWIGYDAAVCVQLFEPWVLEVFNSTTGLPSSMKIVEKGNEIRSMDTAQTQEKLAGWPVTDPDVNRQLNSSRLADVYACGHTNSVNQMLKDNGRDAFYVPSPTVVSFTDGKGSLGYTELSEKFFAQARGLADASNVLPYFAGSGKTLARRYNDRVLSSASVNPVYMGTYVAFILVVGLVAGFFVPKLPLDVPHRGFEVYSWIAAFHADELIGVGSNTGIARNMELDEIEERMGDLKFRYVNTQESS